jgi:uncharacterized protein YbaA (DUF1428 family)
MSYVDGFVLTVPKNKTAAYRKLAKEAAKVWKRYGALGYKECIIDDAKPKWVTLTFPKMIKAKRGEAVWFSYIEFKSRTHRDQVNAKVMAYFDKKYTDKEKNQTMPFDMKRMAYAGFKAEVEA